MVHLSKETRDKAMELVIKYERQQGRNPVVVDQTKCGYDIRSERRCIEVKGREKDRVQWINFHKTMVKKLGKDILNFYLYLVCNIWNEPKLLIFPPTLVISNLEIDTNYILYPSKVLKENKGEIKSIKI